MFASPRVTREGSFVARVPETGAANVENVGVFLDEFFGVLRVEPRLEEDVAQDDLPDVSTAANRIRRVMRRRMT